MHGATMKSILGFVKLPINMFSVKYQNNNNNNNNSNNNKGIKKEAEKILKYKDLTIEIQRMWNVKPKVTPVINRGDWGYFRVIQKIREQHSGKT